MAPETEKVEAVIEEEVESIAETVESDIKDGETSGTEVVKTIAAESEDSAEVVSTELEKVGVTLTADEKSALADEIATKVADKLQAPTSELRPPRKPDRAPRSTHWSERTLFGGKK
jgi:glutamyl-tRNA reductase